MTDVNLTSENPPVRVGVVGLGRSGYGIHLNAFRKLTETFAVVAVADPNTARAKETAAEFDCAAYGSIEELLADDNIELVVVASTNLFHAPHAIAALHAGKHVVCEKPFGLTVADVDGMIAARDSATAKAGHPVLLSPFQNRRFEAPFQKVREILNDGKLGKIIHIRMAYHNFSRRWDWQTIKRCGGGQLNNNGPHPIDQALVFFADHGVTDAADIEVISDLRNTLSSGDAEDHVRLTLRTPKFPDAPSIDIEFFATCAYPQDSWLVMGTSGGLKGNGGTIHYRWVDWSQEPPRPVTDVSTPDRSYNQEKLNWQEETVTVGGGGGTPGAAPVGGLAEQFYGNLYAALRHGESLRVQPEEVRHRIAIIEKARQYAGEV
jgi:scyllo-inositol 2-dehydrogenase (NADP+)